MSIQTPYSINSDVKFRPLELIDINELQKAVKEAWFNQTLCEINDSVLRLGVVKGEFHWHKHDHEDEFFFVLSGKLIIDLQDRSVELLPHQGFTVPKGMVHRTRASERTVMLMIEAKSVTPTGDYVVDQ
jgi:mannose-6-phosphate isomerase-like protein (cupin superfamily)